MTVTTTFVNGTVADADEVNQNFSDSNGMLGEVRMFALSMTGALTKANLITAGWAICDGTTPASQGIATPTIATTPNMENKFISMSDDETSGTTGGASTANAQGIGNDEGGSGIYKYAITNVPIIPPYYELAFFMKVKVI